MLYPPSGAQAADVKRVVDFCRENRPQAIFVGARNLSCKVLKEDMSLIGDFILDAHAQVAYYSAQFVRQY